jgi:hypothetical protein
MQIKVVEDLRAGLDKHDADYWISGDRSMVIVRNNLTPDEWYELGVIVGEKTDDQSRDGLLSPKNLP